MRHRLSAGLLCCVLLLTGFGCTTTSPPTQNERLSLDRPGEEVQAVRTGRFIIHARSQQRPDELRGGQGRFEWLQLARTTSGSRPDERQVLIWLGPLGQTLGSLERNTPTRQGGLLQGMSTEKVRAYDHQGLPLDVARQTQLMESLLGDGAKEFNIGDIDAVLTSLMTIMEAISRSNQSPREFQFQIRQTQVTLRAVLDPA